MRAQQPRVTVAIPTRNRADLLRSCLKSVLDQSLEQLEVVVSDNASTDDTAAVVASFDDPRVHYAPLADDIGLHGNLTRCLALGTAPYVVVLSDDDLMLPGNLERKVRLLDEHHRIGLVHSAYRRVHPDGSPGAKRHSNANLREDTVEEGFQFVWRTMQQGSRVCNPTVVLRRTAVEGERFDAADGPYCDNALWLRVARHHDVGYLAAALAAYRVHGPSQTAQYQLRQMHRGYATLTPYHAVATTLANERFLERSGYDAATLRELRRLLRRHHRRSQLGLRVHRWLPRRTVRLLRRVLSRVERLEAGRRAGRGD